MTRLSSITAAAGLITAGFYLTAYSSGPANAGNDATSSGLGATKCASCHSGGRFGAQTSAELLDGTGEAVSAYVPGQTYRLRVSVATTTAPGGYGFQVLLIDSNSLQAGAFGPAPEGFRISELDDRSYFEHRRRGTAASTEIDWTAPPAGTGPITLYAVGNAVNGNGSTGGDQPSESILEIAEATSVAVGEPTWPRDWRAFSPAPGELTLSGLTSDEKRGVTALTVVSVGGQRLQHVTWSNGSAGSVTVQGLPTGLVGLRLSDAAGRHYGQLAFVR